MNNSHSRYLLGLYNAVSIDCGGTFPRLRKELERDIKRLHSLVESRGLRVLTIDLPAVGKEFDQSLHTEKLSLSSSCLTSRRRKSSPIPRLFGGLVKLVFDERGVLHADPDTDAIRFLRQFYYLAKKWKATCDDTYTFKEVREFFRVDSGIRRPTLKWTEPYLPDWKQSDLSFDCLLSLEETVQQSFRFESGQNSLAFEQVDLMHSFGLDLNDRALLLRSIQRVADIMSATLGYFEPERTVSKHGPGVVSDLSKLVSKYEFPTWSERLEGVFSSARFAFANYGLWADFVANHEPPAEDDSSLNGVSRPYPHTRRISEMRFEGVEMYSKLIAVPKTQKGPRLIAAEPTANQWCQQIIRKFLYDRTHKSWIGRSISFDDQTHNQRLALAASRDGSMSTIDLSAASDRMSCWLVERFFRGNSSLLRALHASRTFIIRNPIDKKCSEFHYLNKFCTMGSAVTFPVQSLVFLGISLAAAHFVDRVRPTTKSCRDYASRIRVFGDDIIVPTEYTECTLYLLQHLGFKVNHSKTYTGASCFRESCGVEAFDGVDVTPSYALMVPRRSAPSSFVSNVAMAHNFFNKKLYATAEFIQRTTTEAGLSDLPFVKSGSGVFGWPSIFGCFDVGRCKQRFNAEYQRVEYLARSVVWRTTKRSDRGPSRLLQYFVEAPRPDVIWESGVALKGVALTRPQWLPLPA